MKRYRYITTKAVTPHTPLYNINLIGAHNVNNSNDSVVIRIEIPNSVQLHKNHEDDFSTTSDDTEIKDLNHVVLIYCHNHLRKNRKLTEMWLSYKITADEFYRTLMKLGWTTKPGLGFVKETRKRVTR